MQRWATFLFVRDESKDNHIGRIKYQGYQILWQDGTKVGLALEKLCLVGARTVLGRCNAQTCQKVEVGIHFVGSREAPLTKLDGTRIRRLFIQKEDDRNARIYFHDATPTEIVFDLEKDDRRVLNLFGLDAAHPPRQWIDFASRTIA